MKRLASAQRALERFEESDLPQFEQWQAARFGETLTRLRDLSRKAEDAGSIVESVHFMHRFSGASVRRCYEATMRSRQDPEPTDAEHDLPPDHGPEWQGNGENFAGEGRASGHERARFGEALDDFLGPAPRRPDPSAARSAKQLYRALALKLHPDHRPPQPIQSAARLDALWHETQEAYRQMDVAELERLDALLDIEQRGISGDTDLSTIELANERHRRSLEAMERALRDAREHSAWMFSKRKPSALDALARRLARELQAALAALQQEAARFEKLIEGWRGKSDRAAARKRGPQPSDSHRPNHRARDE